MIQKGLAPILIVLILAALVGGIYYLNHAEGKFCGGVAANLPEDQCPIGYKCQLEGNYPDASGKCFSIPKSLLNNLKRQTYSCPGSEYINCMPMISDTPYKPNPKCSQDFLSWARASCPNFKGAAY